MSYEVVLPNFSYKERAEEVKKKIEACFSHQFIIEVREEKMENVKNTLRELLDKI